MVIPMKLFLTILIFACMAISAFPAGAKDKNLMHPHADFCEGTSSTAAALKCLAAHKKNAEKSLKKASDDLVKNRDKKTRKDFIETQNTWLNYRDQQCAWEKNLVEGKVAKRLYEASCLSSLTDARAKQLSYALVSSSGEDIIPELGATPRWMNSAFNDYPDVYWTQKKNMSADLDCDDRNEEFMMGISYAQDKETNDYNLIVNILAAANPIIGKPRLKRFKLPVVTELDEKQGNIVCGPDFAMTSFEQDIEIPEDDAKEGSSEEICTKAIKIASKNQSISCPDLILKLEGKDFKLEQPAEGKI